MQGLNRQLTQAGVMQDFGERPHGLLLKSMGSVLSVETFLENSLRVLSPKQCMVLYLMNNLCPERRGQEIWYR
jgi:hypothetical protein